ncbi:hypothetical protein DPMN_117548 [Dreissena polymorpha]|uniref:Uncharacterized protein n=1 Tax=Dreissena polymorpha TaxID=45954 RepID=A0A9D4QVA7_DREPO|nr:hypothetical protein DPMN_117548 [Dreissena polymorpha]
MRNDRRMINVDDEWKSSGPLHVDKTQRNRAKGFLVMASHWRLCIYETDLFIPHLRGAFWSPCASCEI